MPHVRASHVASRASSAVLAAIALLSTVAGAETITVYRDDYGVPHIYAQSFAGSAYAAGYAQAEDRLEQLLLNYRLAAGTMAEIAGPAYVGQDYRSRLWRHEEVARDYFPKLHPKLQAACRAYVAGVEKFMSEHPEQVPPHAGKLEPYYPLMLGRFIIWNWPEGQAADDLDRAGLKPQPQPYLGSNEWLVSPDRAATGTAIALIDPHLSWYGPFRFYEQRMYAADDDFALSGACILGVPMPGLGHTQYASVAMTTGGPDTADIYEETIRPDNPLQYEVDGKWRDMTTRRFTIRVREGDKVADKEFEVPYTHHGPVVVRKGDKAYTAAVAYEDRCGLMDEMYKVHTAHNLDEIKSALATCEIMPQNVMVGTVDGDIFYVHAGRVPVRKHDLPTDRPVPGNVSANDFDGVHAFADLVQVTNPPCGYMQNCNVPPVHMMRESPLTPESAKRPYLYYGADRPSHQRADMVTELLHADSSMTLDDAFEVAFSTEVFGARAWQERLERAWEAAPVDSKTEETNAIFELIQQWDRRSTPDSPAALAYYAFKVGLEGEAAKAVEVPENLGDEDLTAALAKAVDWVHSRSLGKEARYGDFFRVGRKDGKETFPVGGGTVKEAGMSTPRAISFSTVGGLKVGNSGQTSTQIVVLSKPPKSYMVLPLGESDHVDSGHWDDQAAKLFSAGKAKDTFFMDRAGLQPHVTKTTKLEFELASE